MQKKSTLDKNRDKILKISSQKKSLVFHLHFAPIVLNHELRQEKQIKTCNKIF